MTQPSVASLRSGRHGLESLTDFTGIRISRRKLAFPVIFDNVKRIRALSYLDSRWMIRSRCLVAGCRNAPFTEAAYKQIYELTRGNPGQIINLCDFALEEGRYQERKMVEPIDVTAAWKKWFS